MFTVYTRAAPQRAHVLIPWVAFVLVGACGGAKPLVVTASVRDSVGVDALRLEVAPNELTHRAVVLDTLRPDLTVGDGEAFGRIADVAPRPDGVFSVLDRESKRVVTYDARGRALARWQEDTVHGVRLFRDPLAAVAIGAQLLILDRDSTRQIVRFDSVGRRTLAIPRPVAGDWDMYPWRGPYLKWDWPFQHGYEDWTSRLQALGDSGFIHQIQPSEMQRHRAGERVSREPPLVQLVRYNASGVIRDTVATLHGTPTIDRSTSSITDFSQVVYAARPLWAVGDGWLARADRDDAFVLVTRGSHRAMRIAWPADSTLVTADDRRSAAQWQMDMARLVLPEFDQRMRRSFWWQRRSWVDKTAREMPFETRRPPLTALYGGGRCLWLAGFAPEDTPTGTALTLVGLDVTRGRIVGVVRVPEIGARVRRFTAAAVYATPADRAGAPHRVQRFPLPAAVVAGCAP